MRRALGRMGTSVVRSVCSVLPRANYVSPVELNRNSSVDAVSNASDMFVSYSSRSTPSALSRTFATKTEVPEKNVEKMKVAELKELCEELRLSTTGKKADLVERIAQNLTFSKSAVSAVEDEGMEGRDVVVKKTEKQMVALLRRVAESLEANKSFKIAVKGVSLTVPEKAHVSVEHERENGEECLEFQFKWKMKEESAEKKVAPKKSNKKQAETEE